ncbi:MAG: M48 family metalloprotease [Bacteroidales bacterium]|jgi:hypothetical protein|nr:M48 family metalloprotease [Bacteroidales bacterium]
MKKRNLLSVILVFTAAMAYGQISLSVAGRHEKSGTDLTFLYVTRDVSSNGSMLVARNESNRMNVEISWGYLKGVEFFPKDLDQFWQAECLKSKLYDNLFRSGFEYDIRKSLEDEMADYLSKAESNGLFYIDSYLETRLYALLRKVYPIRPTDGRPGVLSLRIISDIIPDAWVGPDGTMILTTGLITVVNSEEELLALMAQEVAHFALDHHMLNYSTILINGRTPSLGSVIRYDLQQEIDADASARGLLKMLGRDPSALSVALSKVRSYGELMGNYSIVSRTGQFPGAGSRIGAGMNTGFHAPDYESIIAPVISHNAYKAYYRSHYLLCQWLLQRNIESGEISFNDYVLMSEAMMRLYDTPAKNEEALEMVRRAMVPGETAPAGAYRQEALLLVRMGRDTEAAKALDNCARALNEELTRYLAMPGDWSQTVNYLNSEMELVGRMRRMMK